jgi:hypothetical protein
MGKHVPLFGKYRIDKYRNRQIRLAIYRNNRDSRGRFAAQSNVAAVLWVIAACILFVIVFGLGH